MKKIFKLLFVLTLLFNVFMLTACEEEHTHEFKEEWANDENYHWHECKGELCFEISNKEEHSWDEGVIVTEPTKETEGEKKYTCTVCNAIKGEKIEFDGISEEKWNSIIQSSLFDNVTFNLDATFISGYEYEPGPYYSEVKLAGEKCLLDGEPARDSEKQDIRELFINTSIAIVSNFDNFEYNEESDKYTSKEAIVYNLNMVTVSAKITAENIVVELDANMNIYKISCKMTQEFEMDGLQAYVLNVTFTFTNYGTTVIE